MGSQTGCVLGCGHSKGRDGHCELGTLNLKLVVKIVI